MSERAVTAHELTKVYPKIRALDGLNLRVPRGSVYGFLGRNGAGKTTTIKILLGLVRPTSGSAQVLGLDVTRDRLAILARTAYVSETKSLFESMSTDELIRFNRPYFPTWSDSAARNYARQLEIPMKQPFKKLSLGNRTKACLLLALAQNAELLILDEPSTGLDAVVMDELLRILIEDHLSSGRTVFVSSHHLTEVERVAEWVGIIGEGKLLLEARLDDIRNEYRRITASGISLPSARNAQVISAVQSDGFWKYVVTRDAEPFAAGLRAQGATVLEVSPLNLQEVFLELVRKEDPCISGNAGVTPASVSSSI